ncbi:MAG TPA: hypothetical protein VFX49_19250 [Chloroflexota bacterium]|nr:hypothetical protein [Chloroflexota bacterium]
MASDAAIGWLLGSDEPAIRFRVRTEVCGEDPESADLRALREEIRESARAQALLSERDGAGRIPYHPYAKWLGAHWVLAALAEIGYPPGDESLIPLREQVNEWVLGPEHTRPIPARRGPARLHGSIEANAVLSQVRLGLADERTSLIVARLLEHQWPDGGWNCDRRPEAHVSSFHETLLPVRALAAFAELTKDEAVRRAGERAAGVFLQRQLFRRRTDGSIIHPAFVKLHFPHYWHYDVLGGLVAMAESGHIKDQRCAEALDLLEAKRLPGGAWPAEGRHYQPTQARVAADAAGRARYIGRASRVAWGPGGATRPNEWVTLEALSVLAAAGRLWPS